METKEVRSFSSLSLKREVLEILAIFLLGAIVNFIFWCQDCLDDYKVWFVNIVVSGSFWVFLWKGSQYIVIYLDSLFPWVENPLKRFLVSLSSVIVYIIIVVYGLDIFIDMVIIGKSFDMALARLEYTSLLFAILITLGINTFMHGRGFLLSWRQASIDNERLRTEQVFTQFQSLKNQVNPHFLFNSLNALSSLVYEDQDRAVEFIRKLSQVYRYVLDKKDDEVVPIQDELSFMENYVFLQKIRFGENLNFQLNYNGDEGYLPPLALQLLVENAIKHNVISDSHPLSIVVDVKDKFCTIRNNVKEKLDKDSTGIGLNNLKERYKYLSNEQVTIQQDRENFEVSIPILDFKVEQVTEKQNNRTT